MVLCLDVSGTKLFRLNNNLSLICFQRFNFQLYLFGIALTAYRGGGGGGIGQVILRHSEAKILTLYDETRGSTPINFGGVSAAKGPKP